MLKKSNNLSLKLIIFLQKLTTYKWKMNSKIYLIMIYFKFYSSELNTEVY